MVYPLFDEKVERIKKINEIEKSFKGLVMYALRSRPDWGARSLLQTNARLNYGGLAAALGADIGLNPREHYFGSMLAFVAGMVPCFLDADAKPESSLLPLRCSRLEYQGPPRRNWSRQRQQPLS